MRVAVTGVSGRLGAALVAGMAGDHRVIALDRAKLDLAKPDELRERLAEHEFDVLINPAALTSPEAAEADPALAFAVNGIAPGLLAAGCRERGARMVHLSSDYVFAGTEPGLRGEDDPTDPAGVYGRSKLAGERAVLAADPSACVLRVSWLFGGGRPGFPEQIIGQAAAGQPLAAIDDKFSLPTWVPDLVGWIRIVLERPRVAGLLHACPSGPPASWRDYALASLEAAVAAGRLAVMPAVRPLRLAECRFLPAPRPRHSALANTRLAGILGTPPRPWQEAVRVHVAEG